MDFIHSQAGRHDPDPRRTGHCEPDRQAPWVRWLYGHTVVAGLLALCWLLLRSGTRPTRLAYPCQKAALSTATLALGVPFTMAALGIRQWLSKHIGKWALVAVGVGFASLLAVTVSGYFAASPEYRGPVLKAPADYRAEVFSVTDCQVRPAGNGHLGINNLLALMGRRGLRFYESTVDSLVSGPGGIIGADDVVVIKINYQWTQRGGTNIDVLSGVVRKIIEHPDGFTGEIVICENGQFVPLEGFDRLENNAKDRTRSPHDVVLEFQALGHNISHYDWTLVRFDSVGEYSAGDMTDGYILHDYNPEVGGRVSYPKFRTDYGTYISLKHGIWDPVGETYSRDDFRFINIPVIKSHSAEYGATASVKNYMGVVTIELDTRSHDAVATGLMGTLLAEIELADLNIIDAMFINANPTSGPATSYTQASRYKQLAAGVDPIALDIWAVKNILIPGFLARGFSPPWPDPSADPDDSTGAFREYLDNSMYQLLAAGHTLTNDTTNIDAFFANGRAGDFDDDADCDSVDYEQFSLCFTGPGGGPVDSLCSIGDMDGDGDVDCDDWSVFRFAWTDSGPIPDLPDCGGAGIDMPVDGPALPEGPCSSAYPNPAAMETEISYSVGRMGLVRLAVYDMNGRLVRKLVDGPKCTGDHTVTWNGRNDAGERVAAGIYFYRLSMPARSESHKIVISR
ncbi:MAG: DUF362 domain-containing protein [bacterium]